MKKLIYDFLCSSYFFFVRFLLLKTPWMRSYQLFLFQELHKANAMKVPCGFTVGAENPS